MLKLVFPTVEMEKAVSDFKKKFYDNGEKTINGSYKLDTDRYSYHEWLELMKSNTCGDTANPKFGLSDTLFAIDEENEIAGIITIRYDLTEFYKNSGHIGYSVAPDKRKRGYATAMLNEALVMAKAHGLSEVKIVCAASNTASRRTILSCKGQLNRVIHTADGDHEEYIIDLKKERAQNG